jgi:hypothetical protein
LSKKTRLIGSINSILYICIVTKSAENIKTNSINNSQTNYDFMKKLFLSVCFLFILTCTYSQKTEPKTYVAFDNSTFKQGDSLYIGYNDGYQKFDYIKEYYINQYDKGFRKIPATVVGKKFKILDIYTGGYLNSYDTSTVVLKIGEKGLLGLKLFVDINNAIRTGEVIVNTDPQWRTTMSIQQFSDSIALLYKIKQSQQAPSNYALEYLQRLNEKNYDKYREDEFELENQKQITTNKIKENVATMSDTTMYYTDIELTLDNYDFETMSFPIGRFNEYYKINKYLGENSPETDLVFINQNNFAKFAVDKFTANSFIKRRKDRHGNIDRTVFARVYFKSTKVSAITKSRYVNSAYSNYIFGTIYHIYFFDFKNRVYNYIGQISAEK